MKTNYLLSTLALGAMTLGGLTANAQETVVVEQTTVEVVKPVECKTHYSSSWRNNWFIQLGAGVQSLAVEKFLPQGGDKQHYTPVYNVGFGHWFSPYLGLRLSGQYGNKMRWDFIEKNKAQMATVNADLMWDMTSSVCGVNPDRVFSFIPFVGVGGTYVWDIPSAASQDMTSDLSRQRKSQWMVPVTAGIQLRFRLCKYVDFFAEARAQFYGDNFNNYSQGDPIDIALTAVGGLSFTIGGRQFEKYNPCEYVDYINGLNNQVNDLRAELAATTVALAAAEAQLPCPETTVTTETVTIQTPMLTAVRFAINSDKITNEEMVNVYNVAEWLKANPEATITLCGYADKDTGTATYNMDLSNRRAEAVKAALVSQYGIDSKRVSTKAFGSDQQPYSTNNWNRIVIFTQP